MLTMLLDLLAIAGIAAILFGCWQLYPPAAYMLAGGVAVFGACAIGRE